MEPESAWLKRCVENVATSGLPFAPPPNGRGAQLPGSQGGPPTAPICPVYPEAMWKPALTPVSCSALLGGSGSGNALASRTARRTAGFHSPGRAPKSGLPVKDVVSGAPQRARA